MDSGSQMPPDEVAYEGETEGGGFGGFVPGLVDAGQQPKYTGHVTSDPTCCKLKFSISRGAEPANATGMLLGEAEPLSAGVPLVSAGDAGWTAAACFPIKQSSYYWYQFEWPSALDAGGIELVDGGVVGRLIRYSESETNAAWNDGSPRNYIPPVTDCGALDASVGP